MHVSLVVTKLMPLNFKRRTKKFLAEAIIPEETGTAWGHLRNGQLTCWVPSLAASIEGQVSARSMT